MNLRKLFEMQRQLDEYIEQKHPRKEGEDRLAKKILALQVELGELANEWRGFKFWSNDQEPRTIAERGVCVHCAGTGNAFFDDDEEEWEDCPYCKGEGEEIYNPLLEEYVDCLHFLLSIGLDENIGTLEWEQIEPLKRESIIEQFIDLFDCTVRLKTDITEYVVIWGYFIGLSEMLGYTWEQIEEAYIQKHAENIARQERGY
ncbi:dimeric dUTPase (all-alpha-NTP-PPase superfamily) [Anoxybacillus voinovskiensis]|uniref:Dimeric dUTPase (All-alpha-NTP-PPase superfamily) n=1 Tax=Anoxybacteroides voinovskiense TaxID=230470 RepID=A0A840DYL1_9BACL|nr:dUTP diphosphatase [Anoxybacillus voinovskiensis]MBB4074086.1 dimeric dUTPase (all-alpha-NTP-PPase superfamily) [Anoxybacillus voinovskiensis]GGJ68484.1 hypothetical protein GCM10008982_17370 [Anoxybacillus voinovskiensis]